MKRIVVIGGGTGTYTVLSAIKHIKDIDITAIVTSADSGGSTGVLRDEFGQLPVGDFRQCLVALSQDGNGDNILRKLFEYRFSKGGPGLEGHNFGNLLITALTDILASEEEAFRKASKILNIQGRVFPITFDDIQLIAEYENGSIAYGEAMVDEPGASHDGSQRIVSLWVQPKAKIYEKSAEAIEKADYIIIGPGDLYTSLLANIVVDGVTEAIKESNAKIIYIPNIVSKWGQTHGFRTSDYVNEIEKYLERKINCILMNNKKLPKSSLKKYEMEKSYAVEDDLAEDKRVIRADLLKAVEVNPIKGDRVKRSLLRHDSKKLMREISTLL
ncbi:hypothetical protein A2713_02365 [candidate division WWE3 bacterium RIFCSPHIGHO2_01_FULL_35_17]|uniref:Putative gluconeogenesis factor n=1 Tax=candidate division WWE3 bacterium RIFCSPHIGHO2_01_FULL_35_17 TaxID=1802614 RepID=A0A1F4USM9_UNCKA|nr:MAG: hypothetical protein A2713_02365 [candidate division WWE3 bacterium RIFCSPHIGHO2_01_FULL_35_17]